LFLMQLIATHMQIPCDTVAAQLLIVNCIMTLRASIFALLTVSFG
jgi:hypothetical protein